MNDFLKIAEDLGWSYNVDDTPNERGEVCVELEKYSPQDQDFIATIWFENGNKSDFMDKLYQYYSDFDPDEEASKWIGEDGHGANGEDTAIPTITLHMMSYKRVVKRVSPMDFEMDFESLARIAYELNDEFES